MSCATQKSLAAGHIVSFQIHHRKNRALLVSFVLFGVCFVLGFALSAMLAGQIEFWHAWGWFGRGM